MKKRLVIFVTALFMMIFIVGFMIVNNERKVELVQAPKSTMEPYEIYNEWKPEFFEEYGFKNLVLPAEVYHERIEKGESYLIGSFYTDNFQRFEYFFQQIYRVLWGEIYDTSRVLEVNDGVHSFRERCLIPQIENKGTAVSKNKKSEYMTVYIAFDDNENKVTIECRKEATKKESKKDSSGEADSKTIEKDKPKTKGETGQGEVEDSIDDIDSGDVADTDDNVDIDALLDVGSGSSEEDSSGY